MVLFYVLRLVIRGISSSFCLFLLSLISCLFVFICKTPPVVCCYFIIMYFFAHSPPPPHAQVSIWPCIFNQPICPIYPSLEDSFLSNIYVLVYILPLSFVVCSVSLYFCFCIQNRALRSVTLTISKCVCVMVSGSG